MKASGTFLVMGILVAVGGSPAWAADRDARIKQCVTDNGDETQPPETISSYCSCMADKMPSSETSSITEWESKNSSEMDACAAGAHWHNE